MPREKESYRENLENIESVFGKVQLIPINKVSEFLGVSLKAMLGDKNFPAKKLGGRHFVTKVDLARWLS